MAGIRIRWRFAKAGDARFLSHLDTLRLFDRALRRAGLPVVFSAGFNPRPRLSLPLALFTGCEAREEVMELALTEPVAPAELCARMNAALPAGVTVARAEDISQAPPMRVARLGYELQLAPDFDPPADRLAAARGGGPLWVTPAGERVPRSIDLRAWLVDVQAPAPHVLSYETLWSEQGSIRPAWVLLWLGHPEPWTSVLVRRTRVVLAPKRASLSSSTFPRDASGSS